MVVRMWLLPSSCISTLKDLRRRRLERSFSSQKQMGNYMEGESQTPILLWRLVLEGMGRVSSTEGNSMRGGIGKWIGLHGSGKGGISFPHADLSSSPIGPKLPSVEAPLSRDGT